MTDAQLEQMESRSLEFLATRFAAASVLGAPTRATMLESILASNEAELSVRFLKLLCALCKGWAVNVVTDEVMTSVYCFGELLLPFTLNWAFWMLQSCSHWQMAQYWCGFSDRLMGRDGNPRMSR